VGDGMTQYGMRWKQAEVIRATEHKGHIVFQIRTRKQLMSVRVTPSGLIKIDGKPTPALMTKHNHASTQGDGT
jgi:hypothetical protein